jgi:branched-chain amino acid aminotransferase
MTIGKILGETYVRNGRVEDVKALRQDMSSDVYYEVVRLSDGKIQFLDDHLERFEQTLSGSGLSYPGEKSILEHLRLLLEHNDMKAGNIRICLQRTLHAGPDLLCYFVPYVYPEQCMYLSGVQLASYPHERPNPRIKKWDNAFRISVQEFISSMGIYEAVLVNSRGEITEGSRSNVFFIDPGDRLITPSSVYVLPGVTRKYVFRICREEGIEVTERPVALQELDQMVSCFISGTSPGILPAWQVDSYQFQTDHPLLRLLMEKYASLLQRNLKTIR